MQSPRSYAKPAFIRHICECFATALSALQRPTAASSPAHLLDGLNAHDLRDIGLRHRMDTAGLHSRGADALTMAHIAVADH